MHYDHQRAAAAQRTTQSRPAANQLVSDTIADQEAEKYRSMLGDVVPPAQPEVVRILLRLEHIRCNLDEIASRTATIANHLFGALPATDGPDVGIGAGEGLIGSVDIEINRLEAYLSTIHASVSRIASLV